MRGDLPKKGQVFDLLNIPDHVVFAPGAIRVTDIDVPVYLPDGRIGGKGRIIEGEGEHGDAILIEVESHNPMVAELFKSQIIGLSIVQGSSDR